MTWALLSLACNQLRLSHTFYDAFLGTFPQQENRNNKTRTLRWSNTGTARCGPLDGASTTVNNRSYFGEVHGRPQPGPHALHQHALLCGQQVVLHGFDEVIFARTAVLHQRFLLYPLREDSRQALWGEELVRENMLREHTGKKQSICPVQTNLCAGTWPTEDHDQEKKKRKSRWKAGWDLGLWGFTWDSPPMMSQHKWIWRCKDSDLGSQEKWTAGSSTGRDNAITSWYSLPTQKSKWKETQTT